MSVLVQYAHPWPTRSRVGARLVDAARATPGVIVNDLYERYPEMHIDAAFEQALLSEASAVVLLHPLYWYSSPAIVKEWQDVVLQEGYAYGTGGDQLKGKRIFTATSTGGSQSSYSATGAMRHTMNEILAPFEQTARFCAMTWLEPFVVYGADDIGDDALDVEAKRFVDRLLSLMENHDGA